MGYKARPRRPSFKLYPAWENVVCGDLGQRDYEDFLWVSVSFASGLDKRRLAGMKAMHKEWQERLEEESYSFGEEDGIPRDEAPPVRFDALFAKGTSARFGAAYFIDAAKSMSWLVRALERFGGVSRVAIGEPPEAEDDLVGAETILDDANWDPVVDLPESLECFQEEIRIGAPTFSIWLYTDKPLSTLPSETLACWNAFKSLVRPARLRWWATETSRQHKKVGKAALGKLDEWLAPGAPPREYLAIELHDGADFNWAPKTEFGVFGCEAKHQSANVVHMSFPASWALTRTAEMKKLVFFLADAFPHHSGHAGLSIRASKYLSRDAEKHAWQQSMAMPTVDVQSVTDHCFAVGPDGVRTLGWMTLVGKALLDELGGTSDVRKELPPAVEVTELRNSTVFTIGDKPAAVAASDDDGLEPYRALHRAIHPLVDRCLPRSKWLTTGGDQSSNNRLWWSRFEPWPAVELSREAWSLRKHDACPEDVLTHLETEVTPMLLRIDSALAAHTNDPSRPERSRMSRESLDGAKAGLYRSLDFDTRAAMKAGHGDVALEAIAFALSHPNPPPSLYAALRVREYGEYVFGGAIQLCLDASDLEGALRYSKAALPHAPEQPDIYFCAARAHMLAGDEDKVIDLIGCARDHGYEEMRGMKEEKAFSSIARTKAFRAACKPRPD